MHCPECNYVTQFNAYMVFHMREHNRLKNPTPIETTEEETNQASCKKTSRGRKLKQVGEGGSKKRNKSLLSEEEMTNVQVDGKTFPLASLRFSGLGISVSVGQTWQRGLV
jgi:hypothetical protein